MANFQVCGLISAVLHKLAGKCWLFALTHLSRSTAFQRVCFASHTVFLSDSSLDSTFYIVIAVAQSRKLLPLTCL
eukprot:2828304-Pleurochrysis_carterae.AAC.4